MEPTSGCPEGHTFCRECYDKALLNQKKCPTCRHFAYEKNLVRNRHLEGMIAQLEMRCQHGAGGKGNVTAEPPARVASVTPPPVVASVAVEALRTTVPYKELRAELRQRGLDSLGGKPELVARLEEDRKKDAGCRWTGRVGGLAAHLGECAWEPVECPHTGCTKSMLPKDVLEHKATCEHRQVPCGHCKKNVALRFLAEHEGCCPGAEIKCTNGGCNMECTRGFMKAHRATCELEGLSCPCPGCDARLLRKDMDAHVEATHLGSAVKLLQNAWRQNAALATKLRQVESLKATVESEQRLAAASPTSWVFNWRADGWGPGQFKSETRELGRSGMVTAVCVLEPSSFERVLEPSDFEHSHFIACMVEGIDTCRMHNTFSILDKHDKILRQVCETGTATTPAEKVGRTYWGSDFTPTAEEKAQSVRADGSIRLRAVVRLFLD